MMVDGPVANYKLLNNLSTIRQFDRPMSNRVAALSRKDITPQIIADAHCSSVVQ